MMVPNATARRTPAALSLSRPDPMVQTYLDQENEGRSPPCHPTEAEALGHRVSEDLVMFRPQGCDRLHLPAIYYVGMDASTSCTRHYALQAFSDRSQRAILWREGSMFDDDGNEPDRHAGGLAWICEHTEDLRLDPERLAAAADGIGAIELVREICTSLYAPTLRALILATPVLGPASQFEPEDTHLRQWHRDALLRAELMTERYGWPFDVSREWLRRLPSTLVITAEIDGFRDAAEGFARRMSASEGEVTAIRYLGAISNFTWLPPLLGAPISITAQQAMVTFLNEIAD